MLNRACEGRQGSGTVLSMVYSGVTGVDWITALNSASVIPIKLTSLKTHTP